MAKQERIAMTVMLVLIVVMGLAYPHIGKRVPIVTAQCTTDTDCMEKFGGDGGLE